MGKFLLILLILASTNTFAAINKWVDDQGRVHYSDQAPPPGKKPTTLHEDTAGDAASSGASATKTLAEQDAELRKENAEKQAAAVKAAQKQEADAALRANCATSQDNLRSLQSGLRIMEVNANGERSFISDAERQKRIAKAQQNIRNYCK